uniref:ABC transporter domain-containing protein n=1 Tax=Meloidogyne incognita TaxID=6306 RepID=A0A914L7T3_MELIC
MPSVLSRLRGNLRDAAPALLGTGLVFAIIHLYKRHYQLGRFTAIKSISTRSDPKSERAHVDFNFIRRLFRIVRVLIPSPFCFEVLLMALIALSLLLRTYADVWMIQTSTGIEASIIARKRGNFIKATMHYLMCMPLVSVVNSFLRFALSELKLRFRERLTHNFYKQYLNGFTFYKMANLDNRILNADQLLTQDVDRFCGGVVDLYSNLSKPLVDVLLYVSRIGDSLGWQAPFRLFFYLIASGLVLTYLRRPIGRMTVMEQQFEGDYRSINSRLIVNSEEIAFYRGNERERRSIMNSFQKMISHLRSLILFRFSISFLDNIVAKYVATVVGWYTMSRPFFNQNNSNLKQKNKTELMQDYYSSGRMMFKLAEALGRLALAGREMTRLAGFTSRVDMLLNVLNDLENGKYQRTMILDINNTNQTRQENSGINGKINGLLLSASSSLSSPSTDEYDLVTFQPGAGKIEIRDNLIRFKRVPLVTPNGDILIKCLDFEVPSGTNVLVCGPNGCGKSSLFRILGELWPLWGGKLIKPEKGKLFYVPQRPYMTIGTLRDQVIYPDSPADARRKSFTDSDLEELLENVQLKYILEREGGWESQQDWMDVLSGGEKQRIAMSRLFYHKPQFAILDECTSAVSADVEDNIYRRCHELGITLFTVSHRKSLWKHHDYSLHMDGRGFYEFKKINHKDPNTQFGS